MVVLVGRFVSAVQNSEKSGQVLDRKSFEIVAPQICDFRRGQIQHPRCGGALQLPARDWPIDRVGEFQLGLVMRCNALAATKRIFRPKGNLRCLSFRHGSPSAIANGGIVLCSMQSTQYDTFVPRTIITSNPPSDPITSHRYFPRTLQM